MLAAMNLLPLEPQLPWSTAVVRAGKDSTWAIGTNSRLCLSKLESAAVTARSPAELERWLLQGVGVDGRRQKRKAAGAYIAMTCHTDNLRGQRRLTCALSRKSSRRAKPRQFRLARLFPEHPARGGTGAGSVILCLTELRKVQADLFPPQEQYGPGNRGGQALAAIPKNSSAP